MPAKADKPPVKKYQRSPGQNGGARPGAGRPPGQPNKVAASLRELAREYTPQALHALVRVMQESDSDAARVQAANAILDRGYGKPSQVLAGDEEGGAIRAVHEIIMRGVRPE